MVDLTWVLTLSHVLQGYEPLHFVSLAVSRSIGGDQYAVALVERREMSSKSTSSIALYDCWPCLAAWS